MSPVFFESVLITPPSTDTVCVCRFYMDGVEIRGLESSPGTRGDACSDAQSADIGFPVGQSQSPAAPSFSADAVDSNRYLAMERCKRGCASECGAEFSGFSMDRSFYIGVRAPLLVCVALHR